MGAAGGGGKKAPEKTAWMPSFNDCLSKGLSGCLGKCDELSNAPGCAKQCQVLCPTKSYDHQKQQAMIDQFGDGKEAWLASTNWYRCMHDSPPVVWSADLEKWAKEWAGNMLHYQRLEHYGDLLSDPSTKGKSMYKMEAGTATEKGSFGENLAFGDYGHPIGVVRTWYNEYKDCEEPVGCRKGKMKKPVGHFTAMIWKEATQMGCARVGKYYICRYRVGEGRSAAPNKGNFEANVLPVTTKMTRAQCEAKQGFVFKAREVLPDCVCKADSACRAPPVGLGKFCYVKEKCSTAVPSISKPGAWLSYDVCADKKRETVAERNARLDAMSSAEVKAYCAWTYKTKDGKWLPRDISPEFCQENLNDPHVCCDVKDIKPCGTIPLRRYCGQSCSGWDEATCVEFDKTKLLPSPCRRRRTYVKKD